MEKPLFRGGEGEDKTRASNGKGICYPSFDRSSKGYKQVPTAGPDVTVFPDITEILRITASRRFLIGPARPRLFSPNMLFDWHNRRFSIILCCF